MQLECMAIEMPPVAGHPNRLRIQPEGRLMVAQGFIPG
jgi:hypothetical protein